MHSIILSHTISNYRINHIKSSNIIKWLTVIQTKWERERKKRIRIREKMKTLQKRKKEKKKKQKFIRNMSLEEIQK